MLKFCQLLKEELDLCFHLANARLVALQAEAGVLQFIRQAVVEGDEVDPLQIGASHLREHLPFVLQAAKDVSSFSSFKTAVEARKAALSAQPAPIEGEVQEADHAAAN